MDVKTNQLQVPRILFLRSNPIAPDPRVEKEARSLSRAGYSVQILGWDRSAALPGREDLDWATIHRLAIRADYARGVMNMFPLLRWQLGLQLWLVRHASQFDVIHACDFDTILPALVCKWIFRKKVVYDIFDFYADHLRNTPDVLKKWIRAVDLWAIGRADGLILVDDQRIAQVRGARIEKMAVVYNSPQDCRDKLVTSEAGSIQVAYIGLLQVERGLLELVEVMRAHPDWKLDLAGFGGDEEQILSRAKGVQNIAWHGRVPYEKALELSARANALVALYDPGIPNHRFASPNKIFEAMMLGKPIIVARNTNMDRVIQQAGAGLIVDYGDKEGLEAALQQLQADPALRRELGLAARRAYEQQYSWSVMEQRLIGLYREVLDV